MNLCVKIRLIYILGVIVVAKKKEQTALIYKDKPLVKRGNTIVYGDINDEFYIYMEILDTTPYQDLELATDVAVSLMSNGRVIKKAEREGIYRALDIGAYWLEDALNQ